MYVINRKAGRKDTTRKTRMCVDNIKRDLGETG
jgi:hypothetical protein